MPSDNRNFSRPNLVNQVSFPADQPEKKLRLTRSVRTVWEPSHTIVGAARKASRIACHACEDGLRFEPPIGEECRALLPLACVHGPPWLVSTEWYSPLLWGGIRVVFGRYSLVFAGIRLCGALWRSMYVRRQYKERRPQNPQITAWMCEADCRVPRTRPSRKAVFTGRGGP